MNTTLNQQQLYELRCKSELLFDIWQYYYRPQMGMEEFVLRYIAGKLPKIKDGES